MQHPTEMRAEQTRIKDDVKSAKAWKKLPDDGRTDGSGRTGDAIQGRQSIMRSAHSRCAERASEPNIQKISEGKKGIAAFESEAFSVRGLFISSKKATRLGARRDRACQRDLPIQILRLAGRIRRIVLECKSHAAASLQGSYASQPTHIY